MRPASRSHMRFVKCQDGNAAPQLDTAPLRP
jgi:hypothetical protein